MDRRNCSRKRAGRAAVGAKCDVNRGTKPLCGGVAFRGCRFVREKGHTFGEQP
jgi:hypothetical protein